MGNLSSSEFIENKPQCLTFRVLCQMLWTWRNKEVMGCETNHDNDFLPSLRAMTNEIMFAQEQQSQFQQKGCKRMGSQIGWKGSRFGWVKVNTDGSSKDNGTRAAVGGLLRDEHDIWYGGILKNNGAESVMVMEL